MLCFRQGVKVLEDSKASESLSYSLSESLSKSEADSRSICKDRIVETWKKEGVLLFWYLIFLVGA
jgi:hypothetical protein